MNIPRPVYSTVGTPLQERAGLTASVDGVAFAPTLDAPPDRPFAFAYAVTVRNSSDVAITIKARKWVIKETGSGRCHVIEGDGVAGCFPRLEPGGTYRFENYHVVAADSIAEGALLACDGHGARLLVRVPAFAMAINH